MGYWPWYAGRFAAGELEWQLIRGVNELSRTDFWSIRARLVFLSNTLELKLSLNIQNKARVRLVY